MSVHAGGRGPGHLSRLVRVGPVAALRLNFLSGTLDSRIDFTRTSAATYVDATGKIVSTPASRNLLTFTQEFDNAVWTKNNVTVTTNSTAAPDGTLTAETLTASANAAVHNVTQAGGASGVQQTFSVYAKAGTSSFVQLWHGAAASIYANFNVSTGVVGTVGAGATATISSAGNGWYRCTITCTPGLTNQFRAAMVTSTTAAYAESWSAAGTETIFLWGAQLEAGSAATDYTRNNGGVYPPRFDYDPVTLAARGLLVEEQRTNLLTYSEQFDNASWTKTGATVTANSTTSPDGTSDADTLVPDSGQALVTAYVNQTISKTASAITYTASVYAKASQFNRVRLLVDGGTSANRADATISLVNGSVVTAATAGTFTSASVSAIPLSNGWFRVALTFTTGTEVTLRNRILAEDSVATTGDGTSGIFIYGAQLEAGAFATSYIPCVASQVTRTADIATITGANFSQWYNQSEGTFVVEADSVGFTSAGAIIYGRGGIVTDDITIRFLSGNFVNGAVSLTGGVTQANLTPSGSYPANVTPVKFAMAVKVNDFAASANGSTVVTDTSGSVPVIDRMTLGVNALFNAQWLNGHIRSIRYYNTRLPNAQLQALTT